MSHLIVFPNPDFFWATFPICPLFGTSPKFSSSPPHRCPPHSLPAPGGEAGGPWPAEAPARPPFPWQILQDFPPEWSRGHFSSPLWVPWAPPSPSSFSTSSSEQKLRNHSRKFLQQKQIENRKQRGAPLLQRLCFSTRKQPKSPLHQCFSYADSVRFLADFTLGCIYFTSQDFSQS